MIWLEADQLIRARSGGTKSIDDYAKLFFGMRDGDWGELTFELPDVVATLSAVMPYDWQTFLDSRINHPGQQAPLRGIEAGGYQLVWKDEPNVYDKARMADAKALSLTYSIGLTIDKDNKVSATQWDSPAFNAGIVTGAKILAVNGTTYDADGLKAAITAAKTGAPLVLLVQRGDRFDAVSIDYRGGLRYPWLERNAGAKGLGGLDLLLAPLRPAVGG